MKPIYYFIFILFISIIIADDATDFVTRNGTKYSGVTQIKPQPNGLKIIYSDGVKLIPLNDLTDEQIAKYELNPETAAEFEKNQKEQQAILYEKNRIDQQNKQQAIAAAKEDAKIKEDLKKFDSTNGIDIFGNVLQLIEINNHSGILLYNVFRVEEYTDIEHKELDCLWNKTNDPRFKKQTTPVSVKKTRTVPLARDGLVFILDCDISDLHEGSSIKGRVYPFGKFTYTNKNNVEVTVPQYSMSQTKSFIFYKSN
jgi:hypothetical protein